MISGTEGEHIAPGTRVWIAGRGERTFVRSLGWSIELACETVEVAGPDGLSVYWSSDCFVLDSLSRPRRCWRLGNAVIEAMDTPPLLVYRGSPRRVRVDEDPTTYQLALAHQALPRDWDGNGIEFAVLIDKWLRRLAGEHVPFSDFFRSFERYVHASAGNEVPPSPRFVASSGQRNLEVVRVAGRLEALEAACKLKTERGMNLYRGQHRGWALLPSCGRLKPSQQRGADEKMTRFVLWVSMTPGLEAIPADPDSVQAVAQHYGVPTTFLDFSTSADTAASFATQGADGKRAMHSIYCIASDSLSTMTPLPGQMPRLVRPRVADLWRLEAQHGVFIEWLDPHFSLDRVVPVVRIDFPDSGNRHGTPTFPSRSSQLEILLEQYFDRESRIEGEALFDSKVEIEPKADDLLEPGLFLNEVLPPRLASWNDDRLRAWFVSPDEPFIAVSPAKPIDLVLDLSKDALSNRQGAEGVVLERLHSDSTVRQGSVSLRLTYLGTGKAVTFSLTDDDETPQLASADRLLEVLWDGMRTLPFSPEQVAAAVATLVALTWWTVVERDTSGRAFREIWGKCLLLEMATGDGSSVRLVVSESAVRNSLRDDIDAWLTPEGRNRLIHDVAYLLQDLREPWRAFEFDRLVDLFARHAIPSQLCPGGSETLVYFSPARLAVIGPG